MHPADRRMPWRVMLRRAAYNRIHCTLDVTRTAEQRAPSEWPAIAASARVPGASRRPISVYLAERTNNEVSGRLRRARTVCRQLARNQITNARLLHLESRYTVEWLLPEAGVSRLHLLCPDPWPKVRHHRRRLVQTDFLEAVWRVLEPGGEFLFMTDHDEYHAWSNKRLNEFGKFERLEWPEDAFFYPKSDFQRRWESEGRTMWRTRCRKGF